MKLGEIATALGAVLENGNPEADITGVAGIEEAGPGQITFLANPKYAAAVWKTAASAIIVSEDFPAGSVRFAAQQKSVSVFCKGGRSVLSAAALLAWNSLHCGDCDDGESWRERTHRRVRRD